MQRCSFVVICLFALAGCSRSPGGTCSKTSDCQSGWVCAKSTCEQLCAGDSECPSQLACIDSMCTTGTRKAPQIDSVVGNSLDGPTHVTDGLLVTGANLGDATFTLSGAESHTLTARTQTASQVELVLWPEVTSGTWTLTAVNLAGSAAATIELLLPELTGDTLLTRLNTATSGTIKLELIPPHTHPGLPVGDQFLPVSIFEFQPDDSTLVPWKNNGNYLQPVSGAADMCAPLRIPHGSHITGGSCQMGNSFTTASTPGDDALVVRIRTRRMSDMPLCSGAEAKALNDGTCNNDCTVPLGTPLCDTTADYDYSDGTFYESMLCLSKVGELPTSGLYRFYGCTITYSVP